MEEKQFRTIFLYEYKLGHKAAEAARNINRVFGKNTVNELTVFQWFQKFQREDESLGEEEGRRRLSVINNNRSNNTLIEADPQIVARRLAHVIGVSHTTNNYLRQPRKSRKLDGWMSRESSENQRNGDIERTVPNNPNTARQNATPKKEKENNKNERI